MRHEASDVAFAIADAGDVVHRAVWIACGVIGSVGRCVAEKNLAILFEVGDVGFVGGVAAVGVGDGNFQDLAFARGVRKGRVGLLDANVDVSADEAKTGVAHHGAGKQARFAKRLKTIADAEDHAAGACEFFDGLHDGRKARDGAGAKIVAVGEAAGQDDGVAIREVLRLVPDEFDGLVQDAAERVKRVVIAIRAGKDYDSELHRVGSPRGIRGNPILAQTPAAESAPAARAGFFGGGVLLWRLLAVVRCGHFAAFFGGPAGLDSLAAAREAKCIRRNVLCDCRTGSDVGTVANFYRRDENGIASDKNAVTDDRGKFIHAIVIAGNRSRADVRVRAQFGVADVTQVRHFAAFADDRFFRFDKISYARAFFQMGPRTNAREWSNRIAAIEMAFEDHRMRFDSDAIAENGVVQDAAGANRTVGAESCFAEQLHAGLDDGVFS